jgi:hypothetical protein
MNKTLLLIIVDFLFLNLIALTRWEKAEPIHQRQPPVPEMAGKGGSMPPRDQDLVELMRLSLADEQKVREQTSTQLQTAGPASGGQGATRVVADGHPAECP